MGYGTIVCLKKHGTVTHTYSTTTVELLGDCFTFFSRERESLVGDVPHVARKYRRSQMFSRLNNSWLA